MLRRLRLSRSKARRTSELGCEGEFSMSWEAIGAIGDFVGGLAVVASLIYLATQVRHSARVTEENTREVGAAARDAVFGSFSRWRALAVNGELSRIFLRGCDDLSDLGREERFQFGLLMQDLLFANQVLFQRSQEGVTGIPPDVALRNTTSLLIRPGATEWWARNAEMFMPAFSEAVSESVAKALAERRASNATQAST
jgi:hypothetical protein